ncbi:unnamed protein product, partial [Polarella glacialis]
DCEGLTSLVEEVEFTSHWSYEDDSNNDSTNASNDSVRNRSMVETRVPRYWSWHQQSGESSFVPSPDLNGWMLTIDAQNLSVGYHYRLCLDVDGVGTMQGYGYTGVKAFVSPVKATDVDLPLPRARDAELQRF